MASARRNKRWWMLIARRERRAKYIVRLLELVCQRRMRVPANYFACLELWASPLFANRNDSLMVSKIVICHGFFVHFTWFQSITKHVRSVRLSAADLSTVHFQLINIGRHFFICVTFVDIFYQQKKTFLFDGRHENNRNRLIRVRYRNYSLNFWAPKFHSN